MHTFTRLRPLFSMTGLLLAFTIALPIQAQRLCETIVADALESARENCGQLDGDAVCYGYDALTTSFHQGVTDGTFDSRNNRFPAPLVHVLDGSGFDAESDEWGIAYIQVGTDLTDVFDPGQSIRFVLMGDVTLENAWSPEETELAFASTYMTVTEASACPEAVNNLVIQTPKDVEGLFYINEVPIIIGSTVVIGWAEENDEFLMYVTVLDGRAVIDPDTPTQRTVFQGQVSVVPIIDCEDVFDYNTDELAIDTTGEPLARCFPDVTFAPVENLSATGDDFRSLSYYQTIENLPSELLNYDITARAFVPYEEPADELVDEEFDEEEPIDEPIDEPMEESVDFGAEPSYDDDWSGNDDSDFDSENLGSSPDDFSDDAGDGDGQASEDLLLPDPVDESTNP
jgi:hypothetical protein